MARLFGLICKNTINFSIRLHRPAQHHLPVHGWGIGTYTKSGKVSIQKGKRSTLSPTSNSDLEMIIKSNVIISHLRIATSGLVSDANAHPFFYGNYIFAHNGTVNKEKILALLKEPYNFDYQSEPIDSEVLFRYLIQNIKEENNVITGLKKALNQVKDSRGTNFVLSDGYKLYAYCYGKPLFFIRRKPSPFQAISKETGATFGSLDLNHEIAFLVCSERLTNENWTRFDEDELITCDKMLNYETYTLF